MGNNNYRTTNMSTNSHNSKTEVLKIVLLGDLRVGKSSLASTYLTGKFNENYNPLSGTSLFEKRLVMRGKVIDLHIWEPINHKIFPYVWPEYVQQADGILLMYDVSAMNTLNSLPRLLGLLKKHNSIAVTFLVGTKSDYEDGVRLTHDDAEKLAEKCNLEFFDCSAKNGENVRKIFEHLTLRILQVKNRRSFTKTKESQSNFDESLREGRIQSPLKPKEFDNSLQLLASQEESFMVVETEGKCPFQIDDLSQENLSYEDLSQEVLFQEDNGNSAETKITNMSDGFMVLEGKCTGLVY